MGFLFGGGQPKAPTGPSRSQIAAREKAASEKARQEQLAGQRKRTRTVLTSSGGVLNPAEIRKNLLGQ